jgi:predicted protein tyrosine phosphatase
MLGKNPYQGAAKRVLFVCAGGILRSATAAHWAAQHKGWNTRSCGIYSDAIPPVHENLLEWAQQIFVMESMHKDVIVGAFGEKHGEKIVVLSIPDVYAYRDAQLIARLEKQLKDF